MRPELIEAVTIRQGRGGTSEAMNDVMEAVLSVQDDKEIVIVVNAWPPAEQADADDRFIR